MSEPITINEPYQIHDGLLDPEKWIEGAVYVLVNTYTNEPTAYRSNDGYEFVPDCVSKTIGPIFLKEPIPEPPEMMNRWRCWSPDEKKWYSGFLDLSEKFPLKAYSSNGILCPAVGAPKVEFNLSTFTCDRFDELPEDLKKKINKAKGTGKKPDYIA